MDLRFQVVRVLREKRSQVVGVAVNEVEVGTGIEVGVREIATAGGDQTRVTAGRHDTDAIATETGTVIGATTTPALATIAA